MSEEPQVRPPGPFTSQNARDAQARGVAARKANRAARELLEAAMAVASRAADLAPEVREHVAKALAEAGAR